MHRWWNLASRASWSSTMASGFRYLREADAADPDDAGADRWLVSYADFMTLLFAFFVVMYSVSSVNAGKFRVLSSSLVTVFQHRAPQLLENLDAEAISASGNEISDTTMHALETVAAELFPGLAPALGEGAAALGQQLTDAVVDELAAGVAEIIEDRDWLKLEVKTGSGGSELTSPDLQ